ncbi:hypothetical protein [Novipirellula galeiformis]|nr:hypothetical protein [Novipirellula galeiformis]
MALKSVALKYAAEGWRPRRASVIVDFRVGFGVTDVDASKGA